MMRRSSILFVRDAIMEEDMNFVFHVGNIFLDKRGITKMLAITERVKKWRL